MARPLRVAVVGGLYHVIVRGNDRRNVFRDDPDRSRYLSRLALYREKFSFRVLAYCWKAVTQERRPGSPGTAYLQSVRPICAKGTAYAKDPADD